ncbi:hypothetical protein [Paenibacillus whitsoniae]|uniref:Uncharacterized protein n=1 Tax=Paenibacillus whitsoniae TaxID=2496558 RepID=A0A430J9Y5_9BACL|nr:hypothetical protein [Paenibacillus whitsoniae]RTE07844.1 hypothetical protein EJQ19_20230 [Paenibacillus whitsoniae]
MSISEEKEQKLEPVKTKLNKVAIMLKSYDASAVVYVEIYGKLKKREVMVEALKRLEDGLIYTDEACTNLADNEFIEVYRKKNVARRDDDFIFLIDRAYAENYVVGAKIMKS